MDLSRILWLPPVFVVCLGGGCDREAPAPEAARKPVTSRDAVPASGITYSVVDEKISDTPIKTQIEQHVIASGVPTRAELEAEILQRYRSAKSRRGFRHHNPATSVYIYVYGTKEQASAGQGLWIGMVAMGPSDKGEPRVSINEERLAALSRDPEERFGLSEQERKEVFRDVVAAEDRATREAAARVPDSEIMKQIDVQRELMQEYKTDLAQTYSLTEDQLSQITVEGITKGWPY